MSQLVILLLIAAAVPVAATVLGQVRRGLSRRAIRERGLPRRGVLNVVALMALVSTLVATPVIAAEGDMVVFSGTITDTEGSALAGITVSVFCWCPDGSTSDPSQNPTRPWPTSRWGESVRLLGETTTGGSGTWSVTVAQPELGYPQLVAWDPAGDYALTTVSVRGWTNTSDLDTSLADGGQLSGRILADGAPPPPGRWRLQGARGMLWEGISLVVAADGSYRTPGLPDGEYSLLYPADLPSPYRTNMVSPLGTISGGMNSTADHNLAKYVSVSGRVTDAAGRALSGIRVVVSPVGTSVDDLGTWFDYSDPDIWSDPALVWLGTPFGARGVRGWVSTAADGTYSIDGLAVPGDRVTIEFHSPEGEYASEYYNDKSGSTTGDPLEIPMEGTMSGIDAQLGLGGRVSGHVRDAGEPDGYARLTLCIEDGSWFYDCWFASTDESGFFEFGALAPAAYTLRLDGSGTTCVVVTEGSHVQVDLVQAVVQGQFIDVRPDAYYWEAVTALAERGVFAGTERGDGSCPDAPIDRQTMAVWTVRVLDGEDPPEVDESRFDDVWRGSSYAPFIERMAELGITQGCGDGSGFCPEHPVTRAQMAAFLSRAYELPDAPDPGFVDVPSDAWYAADVAKLAASGISVGCGDGTGFCPDTDTTRAQMATFLYRAENREN